MQNFVLLAVPLFIFMGVMLEKSDIAGNLLRTTSLLFGNIRGGMAISVIVAGSLLAASTGIVGATVVTMGMISSPAILKQGYNPEFSTGVIASSGTLGQILPPSVVLVLLGSVLHVSVGDLFISAAIPSICLVFCYLIYVLIYGKTYPHKLPKLSTEGLKNFRKERFTKKSLYSFLLPFTLIIIVLGSIMPELHRLPNQRELGLLEHSSSPVKK